MAASNVRIGDWIGISNPASGPTLNTTGMRYVAGSARWSGCNGGAGVLTDAVDGFETACAAASPQRINYRFTANPTAGTGIVDALTRQLEASIQVSDAGPGTLVSIIHDERAPRAELGPSVRATTPLPPEGALPAGSSGEPL